MSKIGTTFVFLAGAAIGGVVAWYYAKQKYAQIAEEEIESVKEAYANLERKDREAKNNTPADTDVGQTHAEVDKVRDKGNITDYVHRAMDREKYSNLRKEYLSPEDQIDECPYVISAEEFNELEGYTPVSLNYFADGVLSDEYGVIFNPEEIIGDGAVFGDSEEDSTYFRDDAKRIDYEILIDERTYEEFRKTLPTNI